MASTAQSILVGMAGAGVVAFNTASAENIASAPQAAASAPSCTVRLNRFYADDKAPLDKRYIGTTLEDTVRRTGPNADKLFPSSSLSGISYKQEQPLENRNQIFYATKILEPDSFTVTFLNQTALHQRLLPNGKHESIYSNPRSTYGVLHNDPNINWTESFETNVSDPVQCLTIRKALVSAPPDYSSGFFSVFSAIQSYSSDGFAEAVWSVTGKSADGKNLKADPTVRFIDRETRLREEPVKTEGTPPPIFKTNP